MRRFGILVVGVFFVSTIGQWLGIRELRREVAALETEVKDLRGQASEDHRHGASPLPAAPSRPLLPPPKFTEADGPKPTSHASVQGPQDLRDAVAAEMSR